MAAVRLRIIHSNEVGNRRVGAVNLGTSTSLPVAMFVDRALTAAHRCIPPTENRVQKRWPGGGLLTTDEHAVGAEELGKQSS